MYTNFEYLREFVDEDNEFMLELIEKFNEDFPGQVTKLETKVNEEKWDEVAMVAHKMQSSTSVFDIKKLNELLENIEEFAMNRSQLDQIPEMIKEIKEIAVKVYEELEAEKGQLKAKA